MKGDSQRVKRFSPCDFTHSLALKKKRERERTPKHPIFTRLTFQFELFFCSWEGLQILLRLFTNCTAIKPLERVEGKQWWFICTIRSSSRLVFTQRFIHFRLLSWHMILFDIFGILIFYLLVRSLNHFKWKKNESGIAKLTRMLSTYARITLLTRTQMTNSDHDRLFGSKWIAFF